MSGVPEVVNISGAEANALVKMSFRADLNVTVTSGLYHIDIHQHVSIIMNALLLLVSFF